MRNRLSTLLLVLAAFALSPRPALTQPPRGVLLGGPSEGDVRLKDNAGHWMLVEGIPVAHGNVDDRSVRVAVIDSGVALDHPQLKGLITGTKDFTGEGIEDRIGHGTVVTILLRAAEQSAPAEPHLPPSSILVAKVASADGGIKKSSVIAAIKWAVAQKARIVNLSLGFPANSGNYTDLCRAIRAQKDVLFVAASGNEGKSGRFYPAVCGSPNLISVGTPDDYSGKADIYANGNVRLLPEQPQSVPPSDHEQSR